MRKLINLRAKFHNFKIKSKKPLSNLQIMNRKPQLKPNLWRKNRINTDKFEKNGNLNFKFR